MRIALNFLPERILRAEDNCVSAFTALIGLLGVRLSGATVRESLPGHPDYPSLLSVSDTLTHFNVGNIAARFEAGKLFEFPPPFLVQVRGKNQRSEYFSVVRGIAGDEVRLLDPEMRRWVSMSREDFAKRYTGVALLAEASDESGEKEYDGKLKEEKRKRGYRNLIAVFFPVFFLAAAVSAFRAMGAAAILPVLFSFLSGLGAVAGILLMWYELDQHNPLLRQVCTAGKNVNCGAILQSDASRIAGISWSLIGFSYFAGEFLLLTLRGINDPGALFVVAWLNLLALPYIIYSIYYQWRVARQWCVLCLSVQAILALQAVIAFAGGWRQLPYLGDGGVQSYSGSAGAQLPVQVIVQAITLLALPFIGAYLLVPALRQAKDSHANKASLQRLKHSAEIFEALLVRQRATPAIPSDMGIVLGNPKAEREIVKVCNPYCGPCAKVHPELESLLHSNPALRIRIIFTASGGDQDIKAPPVRHLLAIAGKGQEAMTKKALDDWYLSGQKDYQQFAAKYPLQEDLNGQNPKLESMHQWCEATGITFTPTIFVNGYQMPEMYQVSDLKYILGH